MKQARAKLVQGVDMVYYTNAIMEEQQVTPEYVCLIYIKLRMSLEKVPSDEIFTVSLAFVKYHVPTKLWSKDAVESSWNQ